MSTEAPKYIEGIDSYTFAIAIDKFTRDFDVPLKVLVGLDKSQLNSNIINYYTQNNIAILKTALTYQRMDFDLFFKVAVAELLLDKVEPTYQAVQQFEMKDLTLLHNYPKIRTGYMKYEGQLKKLHRGFTTKRMAASSTRNIAAGNIGAGAYFTQK